MASTFWAQKGILVFKCSVYTELSEHALEIKENKHWRHFYFISILI